MRRTLLKADYKDDNIKDSFHGRTIYLDLVNYSGQKAIERNLKCLGVVIESCFSKDVSTVITNNDPLLEYKCKRSVQPETLKTKISSSYFADEVDFVPAGSTGPLTRGKNIARKANLRENYGSSNVLDWAKHWKIEIIHIQQAEQWVKEELGKRPNEIQKSKTKRVKRLNPSYIKVEDISRDFCPLYQSFQVYPSINHGSSPHCPFYPLDKTNSVTSEKTEDHQTSSAYWKCGDNLKKYKEQETVIAFGPFRNRGILTAGELQRLHREKIRANNQKGYCEICHLKFDKLSEHLHTVIHQQFLNDPFSYKNLDFMISQLPSMINLIKGHSCEELHNFYEISRHETTFEPNCEKTSSSDEVLLLSLPSSCLMRSQDCMHE